MDLGPLHGAIQWYVGSPSIGLDSESTKSNALATAQEATVSLKIRHTRDCLAQHLRIVARRGKTSEPKRTSEKETFLLVWGREDATCVRSGY